jgi:hypothetical protein
LRRHVLRPSRYFGHLRRVRAKKKRRDGLRCPNRNKEARSDASKSRKFYDTFLLAITITNAIAAQ